MRRLIFAVPLLVFLGIAAFLYRGLFLDPAELPSALIDKPFPAFSLSGVADERPITQLDLRGKPSLVNIWGTWCVACRTEHPVLNKIAASGVNIHGVNYKDDIAAARKWLSDFHDPYTLNISDPQGTLGLDLGVYGAPETFLVDARGIIRYKHVGIVDERVWREQLAPRYQQLVDEASAP
ncbi:DsbE family thiol:disulfide interchange protein [Pseudomonas matsuisoli]|uniref:Thiol:disulfide interchange protein n=1 Tax=Pseudomonas matsuisoli TaxID=1515666 RepID=A0A917Q1L4_9PSED|nr:DsbE family thiol:disulfide interchange protein [Pseudomonas matsuisoli]GGK05372.1 thiol:disulfide interchange protein [Pseudomonas matsuisoli]